MTRVFTTRKYTRLPGLPTDLEHSRATGRRGKRPRGRCDRNRRNPAARIGTPARPLSPGGVVDRVAPEAAVFGQSERLSSLARSHSCFRRRRACLCFRDIASAQASADALSQCHVLTCLAVAGGRLLHPGDPGIGGSIQPTGSVRPRDGRESRAGRTAGRMSTEREKSPLAASLWMLVQEPDVDPARVPEATGAPIRRHRRRDRN